MIRQIEAIEDTLFAVWDTHGPLGWRRAFFYRTMTLDGRWLLTEHELPTFDAAIFAKIVRGSYGGAVPEMTLGYFRAHPLTREMSELYENVGAAGTTPFSVIEGGLAGDPRR